MSTIVKRFDRTVSQMEFLRLLVKTEVGEASVGSILGILLSILIGAKLISALLPGIILDLVGISVTDWPAGLGTLFTTIVPLLVIVAVLYAVIKLTGLGDKIGL